jgi:hypothetical protein
MLVSTLYPGIQRLLMNRPVSSAVMAENIRKGLLELTGSYKFELLQTSGPIVQLVQYQSNYDTDFFLAPDDLGIPLRMVDSFWIYYNYYGPPSVVPYATNAGYNLKYRTINDIEVLVNIPGVPLYWTRYNNQVWFGSMPDNTYNMYMRYQHQHPFPLAGTPSAGDDPLFIPDDWQDIGEYVGALRCARELNLSSKASELTASLYGDAQFQKTDGVEGQPGLIFQRTSQQNRDQKTATKSFRPRMRSV